MAKQPQSSRRTEERKRAPRRHDGEPYALLPFAARVLEAPRTAAVLAGAFVVLLTFAGLAFHTVGDYNVETDFFWSYVPQAKQMLQGTFVIEDFRGPAYPALLGVAGFFVRDFFRAGILLSVAAAGIVLFVMFRLLVRIFRADLAFLAVLMTAVNPTFVQYAYTAGTDMVFAAWTSAAIFFLLHSEVFRMRDLVYGALCAAGAYLTRYNGIFVLLAVPLVYLLVNPFTQSWKERARASALFVGIFLAAIAPWGIYCLVQKGSFFYNRNYLNIAFEMFARGRMSWDEFWYAGAVRYASLAQVVLDDPALFVRTVVGNIYTHFESDMGLLLGWQMGILVIAGILHLWFARPTRRQGALLVFAGLFFAVLLIVFYGERFSLFLIPVYAVVGLRVLTWEGLRSLRLFQQLPLGGAVALVLVAWTIHSSYQFNRENINSGPREIPVIAETVHRTMGESGRGKIVIARKPHIAYYLEMELALFPMATTMEELQKAVARTGASYLFYGYMEAGLRPQFRQLLDPSKAPEWLVPVTYTVAPPAVLYRIDQSPNP